MASMRWTGSLRSSIAAFCQELQDVKDPDTVFREEMAAIEERSRRTLGQLTRNNLPSILQELLANGRYMREREITYTASRAQALNAYDTAIEDLVGRMLKEQFSILGLDTIQRLVPDISISLSGDEDDALLSCPDDEQASVCECQTGTAVAGPANVHAFDHGGDWDDQSKKPNHRVQPTLNKAMTWCTLPGADETDLQGDRGRDRMRRATPRGTSLRDKTARNYRESSPSPCQGLDQKEVNKYKVTLKKGHTLCKKVMKMGFDGLTTCVLLFKDPVRDEWVSAGHIAEGHAIPSLDSILAEQIGRRREAMTVSPSIKDEGGNSFAMSEGVSNYENMVVYNGIGCAS
ncbi:uncharacterized protein FIESC28_05777 [Fusarium coffeatum]|uniref:Uncharacterized protein n=1 Tax=Fusarium coffeatum TaxID=231269 RepID=A0A366RRJ4_9HYPO|nr:uncharacterized protein FIESC28_05777 [Fusarium coffeatum]RBR18955.1 hypothetical protein FIESC28_05777 [Fusarium coffeatum]